MTDLFICFKHKLTFHIWENMLNCHENNVTMQTNPKKIYMKNVILFMQNTIFLVK